MILTDPNYAGMINRVRIVGAVPRLVPLQPEDGEWRLDKDALGAIVTDRTRAIFVANPGMPTGNLLKTMSRTRSPPSAGNETCGSCTWPGWSGSCSTDGPTGTRLPCRTWLIGSSTWAASAWSKG